MYYTTRLSSGLQSPKITSLKEDITQLSKKMLLKYATNTPTKRHTRHIFSSIRIKVWDFQHFFLICSTFCNIKFVNSIPTGRFSITIILYARTHQKKCKMTLLK